MKTNTQNIRISTLFAFANTCKSNSRISLCKYIGRHFCEFLRFRAGKGGDSGDYKKLGPNTLGTTYAKAIFSEKNGTYNSII